MAERDQHLPPVARDDLLTAGIRVRPGDGPEHRAEDPLARFLRIPNHAMFLFTSEDSLVETYLREHWAALDGLTADWCDIHVPLFQMAGDEDFYSQLSEIGSILGIANVQPIDLPALHLWSANAFCTVPLRPCTTAVELRNVLRAVFSTLVAIQGPIQDESRALLLQSGASAISSGSTIGSGIAQSAAGRDIVQVTHIHHHTPALGEDSMSKSPDAPTPQRGQTMEDVKAGRDIKQQSASDSDSQTMRRAEAPGSVTQRKAVTSEMTFGWGRAKGLGIVGLVVAFIAWLAYKYFSHT